jgi:hypothetical protein
MYRYLINLVLLLLMASGFLRAQDNTMLKTSITTVEGDELNGYIKIKSLPKQITIFYSPNDSLVVNSGLIQSMQVEIGNGGMERSQDEKEKKSGKPEIKYFNNTMVGVLSGKSAEDVEPVASLSAETVNGVTIYAFLSTGIGVAYDQYNTTAILPFFVTFRGDILSKPLTPFYFVDAGYGSAWDTRETNVWEDLEVKGGIMFHTGIGFKMYSDNRINVMIALGYKYQKSEYRITEWGGAERVTDRTFKRLSFRLGIGF